MSVRYSAVVPAKMHTIEILTELFNQVRKRFRGVSSEDRAKMTVLNLYEHKTLTALSLDFSCAVSTAYEIVNLGTVLLSDHSSVTALTSEDPKNSVDMPMVINELVDEGYAIVDGTFIHTQNAYKSGFFNHKHKQCGLVFLTFTTPSGAPFWFSEPQPGSVHDMTLLKESGMLEVLNDLGVGLVADKGFQGLDPGKHLTPVKKPKGGRMEARMKEFNYWVTRLRIPVETVFARLKVFKIMVKCRRHTRNFPTILKAVIALHTLDQKNMVNTLTENAPRLPVNHALGSIVPVTADKANLAPKSALYVDQSRVGRPLNPIGFTAGEQSPTVFDTSIPLTNTRNVISRFRFHTHTAPVNT